MEYLFASLPFVKVCSELIWVFHRQHRVVVAFSWWIQSFYTYCNIGMKLYSNAILLIFFWLFYFLLPLSLPSFINWLIFVVVHTVLPFLFYLWVYSRVFFFGYLVNHPRQVIDKTVLFRPVASHLQMLKKSLPFYSFF